MKNYFNKKFIINNHKISHYLSSDSKTKKFYSWFSVFTEEIEILRMSPPGNNNDNSWLHIFTAATTFYFLTNKGNSNNRK